MRTVRTTRVPSDRPRVIGKAMGWGSLLLLVTLAGAAEAGLVGRCVKRLARPRPPEAKFENGRLPNLGGKDGDLQHAFFAALVADGPAVLPFAADAWQDADFEHIPSSFRTLLWGDPDPVVETEWRSTNWAKFWTLAGSRLHFGPTLYRPAVPWVIGDGALVARQQAALERPMLTAFGLLAPSLAHVHVALPALRNVSELAIVGAPAIALFRHLNSLGSFRRRAGHDVWDPFGIRARDPRWTRSWVNPQYVEPYGAEASYDARQLLLCLVSPHFPRLRILELWSSEDRPIRVDRWEIGALREVLAP